MGMFGASNLPRDFPGLGSVEWASSYLKKICVARCELGKSQKQ
jgi:hypothetical protein